LRIWRARAISSAVLGTAATALELRIARLASQGKSNDEIAQTLVPDPAHG